MWWMRIQGQVSQDLLDHRPLEDGRNDLELTAAAGRPVLLRRAITIECIALV
jgi:hypothetical protein